MTMRKALLLVFTLGLSGAFVWLAASGIHWDEFLDAVRTLDAVSLLVFVALHQIVHYYRVMRIRILIEPLGGVSFRHCFVAGSVGCFALMTLPFRLGDLVRPYLIKKMEGLRMSAVLATAVVERVMDGLVTSILLFIAIFWMVGLHNAGEVPALNPVITTVASLSFPFFLSGVVFLVVAYFKRALAVSLMRKTIGAVAPRLEEKVESLLGTFLDGLQALPNLKLLAKFLAESVVYWLVNAFSNSVLLAAMGVPWKLALPGGLLALGLQIVGVLIPAAPSGVGPFHYFSTVGAMAVGLTQSQGLAFSTAVHTILFIIQIVWGGIFLLGGKVNLRAAVEGSQHDLESNGLESQPAAAR